MTAKGIPFDLDSYQLLKGNQERLLLQLQSELNSVGFIGEFNHVCEKLTVAPQNLNVVRTFERLGLKNMLATMPVYKNDRDKPESERRRKLSGIFDDGHKSNIPFLQVAKNYHDLIGLFQTDWEEFIDSDGRIRASVVFPGTNSYRTQQEKPNPLMLPYFARPLFHASLERNVLLESDFKCQEVGLASDFYGEEKLLQIYNTFEKCLYCEIGAEMNLYPKEPGQPADPDREPDLRATIKTALLALQYGGSVNALKQNLNLNSQESHRIIDAFWGSFPKLKEGRAIYFNHVRYNGRAVNRIGLTRGYSPCSFKDGYLVDSTLSYLNFPVQSGGAGVLMLALAELPAWTNPVLTMHDAILLDVPQDAVRDAAEAVEKAMATAMQKSFPSCPSVDLFSS